MRKSITLFVAALIVSVGTGIVSANPDPVFVYEYQSTFAESYQTYQEHFHAIMEGAVYKAAQIIGELENGIPTEPPTFPIPELYDESRDPLFPTEVVFNGYYYEARYNNQYISICIRIHNQDFTIIHAGDEMLITGYGMVKLPIEQ